MQRKLLGDRKGVRGLLLHGMGGVGKSTLAERVSTELKSSFPGGVFWVTIARPASHSELAGKLIDAQQVLLQQLNDQALHPPESVSYGQRQLEVALKQKQQALLLVIDNVPEFDGSVRQMLPDDLGSILADG